LFPQAAVIVHHGGVGTTAQALRSGRPQLIVPYLVDQPDNAARVQRLGAGRTLKLKNFQPRLVTRVLQELLADPQIAQRAAAIAKKIHSEDGTGAAVRIIADVLSVSRQRGNREQ
jgi:rhamnosyltransferase subunit B